MNLDQQLGITRLLESRFSTLEDQAIELANSLNEGARHSSEDSGLDTFWLEFADQVQNGESSFWGLDEKALDDACVFVIERLSEFEKQVLWFATHRAEDWDFDATPKPFLNPRDVADTLYRRLVTRARNVNLEAVRDSYEQREAMRYFVQALFTSVRKSAELSPKFLASLSALEEALGKLPKFPEVTYEFELFFELSNQVYLTVFLDEEVFRVTCSEVGIGISRLVNFEWEVFAWGGCTREGTLPSSNVLHIYTEPMKTLSISDGTDTEEWERPSPLVKEQLDLFDGE